MNVLVAGGAAYIGSHTCEVARNCSIAYLFLHCAASLPENAFNGASF